MTIAGICIAGGIGSVLRFWLGQMISAKRNSFSIPIGILTINILGAFGLGVFTALNVTNPSVSTIISTGFFGAFTTFSTFSVEAVQLLLEKRVKESLLYTVITLCGCLVAFWCGIALLS
ncbi:fluoride efflux transporter CrcB [Bacillus atrophaeus]|uniref:fluoride efflux transporter CrcB n=1 Tax=Bacillus atrophaeus TaxID=1452 RepID=UPI001EFC2BD9|nr:fluoride efflux transporter CrcB [Bacillus atrophaeus]MCG8395946.1 fluoride efflux transporter CrcB [Bacillus atrophaeus]